MRSAHLIPAGWLLNAGLALCAGFGVWLGVFPSEANADSWERRAEGPGPRASHSAVWTGHEMIVWGGGVDGRFLNDGGRYNPETNAWRRTSPSNAPTARWFHAGVWTGSEMLIWGGRDSFAHINHRLDGARYNPLMDSSHTHLSLHPSRRYESVEETLPDFHPVENRGRTSPGGDRLDP